MTVNHISSKTRRIYDHELLPSLKRIFRKTATLDTDYEHPSQLGAKIADCIIRAGVQGQPASARELASIYTRHGGTSSDPQYRIRAYVRDIRNALDANPNTSFSVVGDKNTGWMVR